jgi:hypothetical protein
VKVWRVRIPAYGADTTSFEEKDRVKSGSSARKFVAIYRDLSSPSFLVNKGTFFVFDYEVKIRKRGFK